MPSTVPTPNPGSIAAGARAETPGQWVQSIIECGVDNDYAAAHRGDGYARLPDDLDSLGSPTAASKKHRRGSVGNVSGRGDLTMAVYDSDGHLILIGRDSNIADTLE